MPYRTLRMAAGRVRLMPGDDLMESICNENDQDPGHYTGPPHLPTDGLEIRPQK
jgi:hypothetical protein